MVLRVLLVGDGPADTELIERALRAGGHQVEAERVDGEPALIAALARDWDLVVSDHTLPRVDGLRALRVVRERAPDLPFIVVSGAIGEEVAVELIEAGADDHVLENDLGRLVPAVTRAVRDARVRADARPAQAALRDSEARFRTLVSSLDDLVFTLDRDGRFTGVYGRWSEREGLAAALVMGKRAADVAHPAAAVVDADGVARALAGERAVYEGSLTGAGAPEQARFFQTSLDPIVGADGEVSGVVGVARDVTDQRRMHAQLLASDRMVSVGTLAAGVAHEINNPLAAVVANVEYVQAQLQGVIEAASRDALDGGTVARLLADIGEPLDDVSQAAERVRRIVRDVKVFSRAADDHDDAIDVREVLDSSARMAWNEIRHRARLVKHYGDVPLVRGNLSRLGQVFLNLIVNAVQAIPEGQVHRNLLRLTANMLDEDRVAVEVTDTGSGMPPELVGRLFTPFVTTKPPGVGTGLGLSICHRIVSELGGEIRVVSEVGVGTTFLVVLPAAADRRAADHDHAVEPAGGQAARVLVIDDEPMIGSLVRRVLGGDHHVEVATRAHLVLAELERGTRFDVILCDLMMPGMTGMEFHAELVGTAPDQAARLVFLTGGAFTAAAREFLDQVPNPRLEKPFDLGTLRALIEATAARPW